MSIAYSRPQNKGFGIWPRWESVSTEPQKTSLRGKTWWVKIVKVGAPI